MSRWLHGLECECGACAPQTAAMRDLEMQREREESATPPEPAAPGGPYRTPARRKQDEGEGEECLDEECLDEECSACAAIASAKVVVPETWLAPKPAASAREEVPADVHERGWQWRPVGDGAFAPPFGTVRACVDCGCLVAGGPTRCGRCAPKPAAPTDRGESAADRGESPEPAVPAPEPDEAERTAASWLERYAAGTYANNPHNAVRLAALLRAAERRGYERGVEEAARVAEGAAASMTCARRIRALAGRGT